MKFKEIDEVDDLVKFLISNAKMMQNTNDGDENYVYHYTKQSAIESIIKSGSWYLNSPFNMNDGLEKQYIKKANIENLYFSSFLTKDEESIAMWSMYSLPWENGVLIRIPIKSLKDWIKTKPSVYKANRINDELQRGAKLSDVKIVLHYIAYTNMMKVTSKGKNIVYVGKQANNRLNLKNEEAKLAGYLKDTAWSYEKEVRLRVVIPNYTEKNGVFIDIPQEVMDSFEFVQGPRFYGNLLDSIRKINFNFDEKRIFPSVFTGRLDWIPCDSCEKNMINKEKDEK